MESDGIGCFVILFLGGFEVVEWNRWVSCYYFRDIGGFEWEECFIFWVLVFVWISVWWKFEFLGYECG